MECLIYQTIRQTPVPHKRIRNAVFFVLSFLRKKDRHISVHLIGDRRMARLNRVFRGVSKTTDVLSFSAAEGEGALDTHDIGDIFLSIPQIRRQARRFGVSFKEEFFRMLVHGILHLCGHDHERKNDAKRMFGVQEKLIRMYRY